MERARLEDWIAEGRSVEEIARLVGRHPSTVSYWLEKYGLRSAHADKHAARGGIPRDQLEALVARDLTVRQIAEELGHSATNVRYWLGRHGLQTTTVARRQSRIAAAAAREIAWCQIHGEVPHFLRTDGSPRCARCSSDGVTRWRRRAKKTLVEEAGGRCVCCGYDRCLAALQFHHRDPTTKRFTLANGGRVLSIDALRAEAAKCALVCSNCHVEIEMGIRRLDDEAPHDVA